jgi:NAD(P)-dependent dehydrogenase (short-subunit alcohol dehydrogenase family)
MGRARRQAGPILITGAGSGFGKEVALRLTAAGHEVIAGVEIIAQVGAVRAEARQRGAELRVEKLDMTDPGANAGSKHAVEAFSDALDQELAEFGVTVARRSRDGQWDALDDGPSLSAGPTSCTRSR